MPDELRAPPTPATTPIRSPRAKRWFLGCFAALVLGQTFLAFMGAGDRFCVGHNGWNSSAYLQSARNTVRWGSLFPVQYYTDTVPPTAADTYTHHPLAMHLHNVLALELFGDHEGSVRAVPAFFGVLALVALMLVVRRLYGEGVALLAGALYLVSPINAIYTNMSNHENGFIFWTFWFGLAYLRFIGRRAPIVNDVHAATDGAVRPAPPVAGWGRWYAFMLFAFFWAAMWDWPAYYVALVFAAHWFAVLVAKYRRTRQPEDTTARRLRRILPDLALLGGFSALVLGLFVGHFVLVSAVVGSTAELQGVFEARQAASSEVLLHHLAVVPLLLFTAPVLVIAFGWFFHRAWRAIRGRFERRDLLAFAFAIAGLLHYYIFRGTAVRHEYWGWTLIPFTAIACSQVLLGSVKRIHTWLSARLAARPIGLRRAAAIGSAAIVIAVVVLPLAERLVDLVPAGRAVGGSLWLGVAPTRTAMGPFVSGRDTARFAQAVHEETTRAVGVIMDPSVQSIYPYEPRIEITLDREIVVQGWNSGAKLPTRRGVTDGWVYIVPRARLSERRLVQYAAEHPVLIYGGYVMVDLRPGAAAARPSGDGTSASAVRVVEDVPCKRDFWTWYWEGPWAEAVCPVEQPNEEARLTEKARTFHTAP